MLWLLVACTVACARNVVTPMSEHATSLPPPVRVLVYDPAFRAADVIENKNTAELAINPSGGHDDRDEIGKQAASAFAAELVDDINTLGLRAERARRNTPVPRNALLVVSQFLDVDEGNRMKRLVVGFGNGASRVDARVQVYYSGRGGRTKLLEFETHSDSGKMPGGGVTLGAGAVVTGGVSVVSAAGAVATGGVKVWRSSVEKLAASSAEQASAYLSEYFGKRGWIAANRVTKAKQ